MSIEYGLVFTFFFSVQFDIPYSILFVQVTLSLFSEFNIVSHYLVFANKFFFCAKKKKRVLIAKLLRIYYVRRLSVSYHMNVRTSQKMLDVHR